MRYKNTTNTSVFAGGAWVEQGGTTPSIKDPNVAEAAIIKAEQLVPISTKTNTNEVKK